MFNAEEGFSPVARPVHPRRPRLHWFTLLAIWAGIFLLVWSWISPRRESALHNPSAEPRAVTARGDLAADEQATINIFRAASPAVVYITTVEQRRNFFNLDVLNIPRGTGSGFIYDREGYVVTNSHVILVGDHYIVTLADQSEYEARMVGIEPDKDIAVLKIDAPADKLTPLALGTSGNLLVGQKVFAIGNPFGFDQTLTTGVVSALGREITSITGRTIHNVIQTDAAINPGNSGGPLLDSAGRLIGINTQIASPSGASVGIGFAVPVDTVNAIVPDIIRYGRVIRPALGVQLFQDARVRQARLPGPLIEAVQEGSGAERAGLRGTVVDQMGLRQLGDVIIKINDIQVTDSNELKDAIEPFKSGDKVRVTYLRDGKQAVATVELQTLAR